jgi:hypothetical protein
MSFPDSGASQSATLTVREAFLAMSDYIWRYGMSAGDDLITLIGDTELEADGGPKDPAAWDDWMASVERIKAGRLPRVGP